MWLRANRIRPVYVEPGPDGLASAAEAERLVTARTRAVVLVTPGNPSGATVSPDTIGQFAALARRRGAALVFDETYRCFRDTDDPPHRLFAEPGWADTVVSLHSFSKEFAIPGHRVGAIVAGRRLTRQVEKIMDCVAVCAPRIGQEGAWAGLTFAVDWRAQRACAMAARRAEFMQVMSHRPGGFELLSCGGFFGWLRHPFPGHRTADVAADLLTAQDMLVLPGTAFEPDDRATLRVSVGNLDADSISMFAERLAAVMPPVGERSATP
ncbi:aminotransferase class I/II-fold pyridoxal phosphate-dependent enzyme [Actinomycetes bacterium KLBMP 9759]